VAYPDDAKRIERRTGLAGATVSAGQAEVLAAYLDVLRRWNQRGNLTAFELNPPSDGALDRLIVEPIVAAKWLLPADRLLVDIGSGGGSPGIPLRIVSANLRVVLVEARARKAAFLREAVRQLGLDRVEVENRRFEELAGRSELRGAADVVTVRAVRTTREFWLNTRNMLHSKGRAFFFGTADDTSTISLPVNVRLTLDEPLVPANGSRLFIISRLD